MQIVDKSAGYRAHQTFLSTLAIRCPPVCLNCNERAWLHRAPRYPLKPDGVTGGYGSGILTGDVAFVETVHNANLQ